MSKVVILLVFAIDNLSTYLVSIRFVNQLVLNWQQLIRFLYGIEITLSTV